MMRMDRGSGSWGGRDSSGCSGSFPRSSECFAALLSGTGHLELSRPSVLLTGYYKGIGGGFIYGADLVRSPSANQVAAEFGIYTPQVGVFEGYGFQVPSLFP